MIGYVSRGGSYIAFLTAAVVAMADPFSATPEMLALVPIVWGLSMFISSVICLFGVITRTWVGEYVGIPFLLASMLAFATVLMYYDLLVLGILLVGLSCLLVYRWYMVAVERRNSIRRQHTYEAQHRFNLTTEE